jgi:hypothetical protein
MDLISRQEALEAMIRLATPMRDDLMGMIREAVITECSDAINALPYAQKTGHWMPINAHTMMCSICGEYSQVETHYCANCGARMG